MDPIVNRWSSCQADHYSSSESSEDEFSDKEFLEEEEGAEDFLCVEEVSVDSEQVVKETTRVSIYRQTLSDFWTIAGRWSC